jgi:hypothetical protein
MIRYISPLISSCLWIDFYQSQRLLLSLSPWEGRVWFPNGAEVGPEEGAEALLVEAVLVGDSAEADSIEADSVEEAVLAEAEEDLLVEAEVGDKNLYSLFIEIF